MRDEEEAWETGREEEREVGREERREEEERGGEEVEGEVFFLLPVRTRRLVLTPLGLGRVEWRMSGERVASSLCGVLCGLLCGLLCGVLRGWRGREEEGEGEGEGERRARNCARRLGSVSGVTGVALRVRVGWRASTCASRSCDMIFEPDADVGRRRPDDSSSRRRLIRSLCSKR